MSSHAPARRAAAPARPVLRGEVRAEHDGLVIDDDRRTYHVSGGAHSPGDYAALLKRCDGSADLSGILAAASSPVAAPEAARLLAALDADGLIDDAARPAARSGLAVILEIEDRVEALCRDSIFVNPFWETCLAAKAPGDLPHKLATGMVIENWHFLFRESYFDAPVLSYVANNEIRLLLNQFFSEEYGHDEILLRTLNFVGLTREDMLDAIPLPETMALCNALAYWAHNDPIFFFTTLGLLEGQGMKHDSFIEACTRCGFDEEFVKPLRTHANINLNAAHGNLTRSIFAAIPAIDGATEARLKRQVPLFVELYNDFYTGVWRYYSSDAPLLRRVSEA